MAVNTHQDRGCLPVFILCRSLPDENNKTYSVHEICSAAEKKTGYDTILGAQRMGSIWRLYPKSENARTKLLLGGLTIRQHSVSCFDKNPFIVHSVDGDLTEIPTTKVVIGNVPLSYSNAEIEGALTKLGCIPRSKLMMERDRDDSGGLTRWLTGRRFIYIEIPARPLPLRLQIGSCKASLFHREQKLARQLQTTSCTRCLTPGHTASTCEADIICRACHQPGHKEGDPSCSLPKMTTPPSDEESRSSATPTTNSTTSLPKPQEKTSDNETMSSITSVAGTATPSTPVCRQSRSTTQSTLSFPRSRSCTPGKRQRASPGTNPNKSKTARKSAAEKDVPMSHHDKDSPLSPLDSSALQMDDNHSADATSRDKVT